MTFDLENIDNKVCKADFFKKKEIFENTFCISFKVKENFYFKSGQYVWVELINPLFKDEKGDRRAFSISNIQNKENVIEVILRKSDSAFNKSLLSLNGGEEVNIIGPNGYTFLLKDEYLNKNLVFIAGGVGVTPFLSILRDAHNKNLEQKINLFYGENKEDAFLYKEELDSFKNDFLNINYIVGKIDENHFKNIDSFSDSIFFISGKKDFVFYIYNVLKNMGIHEEQFVFEQFYPTKENTEELEKLFFKGKPNLEEKDFEFLKEKINLIYSLVESASNHILVTDLNGKILFANEAAQRITGFSIEEMLGNTPRLWGGLMDEEFYKKIWSTKESGLPVSDEVVNRRKNGDVYIAKAHISPIKNDKKSVVGFIASEEDVTSLRFSEYKAKQNEERFLQLVQNIPEIYWIIDLKNNPKITYVSPSFEQVFDFTLGEIYEDYKVWTKNVLEKERDFVQNSFDDFLKGDRNFNIEFSILGRDKKIFVLSNKGEILKNEKGEVVRAVGVTRDITKEKEIDKIKTEFVSLVSHQLKTPVGAMRWNLEMLLAGDFGNLSEEQKEVIKELQNLNVRTSELVNDFLDVSRIEMGTLIVDLESVDVSNIVKEVLKELKQKIDEKNISIIDKLDKNIGEINADKRLLRIIFQNLISNAVKYSNDNSSIEISFTQKENNLEMFIKDSGVGIKEEEKEKIFTKMFRGSNANEKDPEGNGLGLYLTKEIIKKTGGDIYFDSEFGRGTIFYVVFPKDGMKNSL